MHFNPNLHVRADESRKIQDLIQIESSWVLLCDGSHSENIKSLLEERSCQPFRVTEGSSVSSHRSTLPLKTERNRDKCVSAEDESKEIRRFLRVGKWNRWLHLLQLTPVPHLNLRLRLSSLHAYARKRWGGVGVAVACGDDYPSGRIWNWENRIRTQNVKIVRWMQHILVRNNCFLLVRINY